MSRAKPLSSTPLAASHRKAALDAESADGSTDHPIQFQVRVYSLAIVEEYLLTRCPSLSLPYQPFCHVSQRTSNWPGLGGLYSPSPLTTPQQHWLLHQTVRIRKPTRYIGVHPHPRSTAQAQPTTPLYLRYPLPNTSYSLNVLSRKSHLCCIPYRQFCRVTHRHWPGSRGLNSSSTCPAVHTSPTNDAGNKQHWCFHTFVVRPHLRSTAQAPPTTALKLTLYPRCPLLTHSVSFQSSQLYCILSTILPCSQRHRPGFRGLYSSSPFPEVDTSPSHNPANIDIVGACIKPMSIHTPDRPHKPHRPHPRSKLTLYLRYPLPNTTFIPSMSREHTNTRVQKELHRTINMYE